MSVVAKKETWRIGGPGTLLPRPLESFLSWALAIGCLSVSGYHYLKATFLFPALAKLQQSMRLRLTASSQQQQEQQDQNNIYVPLTTCSRAELGRATAGERLEKLFQILTVNCITRRYSLSDEMLVDVIRSEESLRRLASLAMRGAPSTGSTITMTTTHPLRQQLERVWPRLLALPPQSSKNQFPFDISLILPAHGERAADLFHKLNKALLGCLHPDRVEVIVVDAGGNDDLDVIYNDADHRTWGSFQILNFTSGGGRGPCLNFGAKQARGRHYCFCHSDTTLPHEWDTRILEALDDTNTTVRANACAFSFGIDTSPNALLHSNKPPPGIRAVITTANWRTHLYSLPYGDQVLSVPAVVFRFVGGFPDQCLMEDYELVSLLRRRAAATQWQKERLVILGGAPALCSPRRWEKFGVLFVTFMNSKFVNLYAGGLSPDDLYRKYYGKEPPARSNELAPWEVSSSFSNSQQGGCIIMMDPIDQDLDLAQGLTVDT